MGNLIIDIEKLSERFAYLVKLSRMGVLGGKPAKNSRILVSRNKREGWYFGKAGTFKRQDNLMFHCRTWSKPASLRYCHIKFGQVRFEGLGIQLHTPTGEPHGNT